MQYSLINNKLKKTVELTIKFLKETPMPIDYHEGFKRINRIIGLFWLGLVILILVLLSLLILTINIISIMIHTGNVPWLRIIILFIEIILLGGFGYIATWKFSKAIIWVVKGFIGKI